MQRIIKSSRVDYPLFRGANTDAPQDVPSEQDNRPPVRYDDLTGEVIGNRREQLSFTDSEVSLDGLIHGLALRMHAQGDDLQVEADLIHYYRNHNPEEMMRAMGKLAHAFNALQADSRS